MTQTLILLHHPDTLALAQSIIRQTPRPVHLISVPRQATLEQWQTLLADTPWPDQAPHLATLLDDDSFRTLWQRLSDQPLTVLPLPWADNPRTCRGFHLPRPEDAADYFHRQLSRVPDTLPVRRHALVLEEHLRVLDTLTIGPLDTTEPMSLWTLLRRWRQHPDHFQLQACSLTTAKGRQLDVACLQMRIGEESVLPLPDETPPWRTGKLCARLEAPRSFFHLLRQCLSRETTEGRATGWIRTDALTLESERPFVFHWNGQRITRRQLHLRTIETRCRIVTGAPLVPDTEEKETVRLSADVPQTAEAVATMKDRMLPLFPVADETAFAELFSQLRQQARFTQDFAILLILSVLIAAIGLLQDASPVVIGAMVLAPLMAPIISLSMGLIRLDRTLIQTSARTVALGAGLAVALALLAGWLLPSPDPLPAQIDSRTHPNLLDLWVAMLSGIAAAYVHSRKSLAQSLAGVAIAVALVPPLAAAGLGLSMGEWLIFGGAFLLFLVNLVGILFAAGVTFHVLGFASFRTLKVALPWKLLLVVAMIILLVSVPL